MRSSSSTVLLTQKALLKPLEDVKGDFVILMIVFGYDSYGYGYFLKNSLFFLNRQYSFQRNDCIGCRRSNNGRLK